MGAPGDSVGSIGCTIFGDQGQFQAAPHGDCTATGLDPGAMFISNSGGLANYTGQLSDVLTCIAALGSNGCGFEHQLASVARALGADGLPPPATNAGFLRDDAELAIILLSNEDDCSAPAGTTLYSLNGFQQSQENPLGPIANYRCNQFGHLCKDPQAADPDALVKPPQELPAHATASPPVPDADRLCIRRRMLRDADACSVVRERHQGAEGGCRADRRRLRSSRRPSPTR